MEADLYRIHISVKHQPTKAVVEVVRLFKQISTYRLWRQNNNHVNLREQFRKEKTFGRMIIPLVV